MTAAKQYPSVPNLAPSRTFALMFDMEWAKELRQIRRALKRIESGEQRATERDVWLITSRLALHLAMFPDHHGSEAKYDPREQLR